MSNKTKRDIVSFFMTLDLMIALVLGGIGWFAAVGAMWLMAIAWCGLYAGELADEDGDV
jgi:hypothetical protein